MNDTEALLGELLPLQTPDVSSMPAAGWWFVLLVVVIGLVSIGLMLRRYRQRRWLRDAKRELDAISELSVDPNAHDFLSALSRLLRRVLIKYDSRAAVASLQGDAWLARLDAMTGDKVFQSEIGALLSEGPYRRSTSLSVADQQLLIKASEDVIRQAGKRDV